MTFYVGAVTNVDELSREVRAALESDLTIDITTIGRRSGAQRRIEIWFLNVGGVIYFTGTPGRRDWFANLAAHPTFTFHLKESTQADLTATAEIVTDLVERRRVFESDAATWYRQQGDTHDDFIANAPMVRITSLLVAAK